jgi:hypothetical protein
VRGNTARDTHLRDIDVRLHNEERVERIRTARVRVVEEVLDLRERRLSVARAVLGLCGLRRSHPEWVGCVRERVEDTRVQRLYLLQPCGRELALRWRTLVHADADEDLAQEGKDARDVVEPGDERCFAYRLRQVCARGDAAKMIRLLSDRTTEMTDYSSSISFGKWTVQSSSRREIGRPSRIDSDLSAGWKFSE